MQTLVIDTNGIVKKLEQRGFSCRRSAATPEVALLDQHPEHSGRTSTLRLIVVAAIAIVVCATVLILVLNR
jgi:hypothetical protein